MKKSTHTRGGERIKRERKGGKNPLNHQRKGKGRGYGRGGEKNELLACSNYLVKAEK